ncbi:perforin-1-like [Salmo trutta]|uniref:perforin-1-like n=1 Tax=Salmo trutta TaxID=8032 RepID=UPI0011307782|nr:perforin-1-like [Salmo trutta]
MGGSQSDVAIFATTKTKEDRHSFFSQNLRCRHYSYRTPNTPTLSNEFRKDIDRLGSFSETSKAQYRRLIDTYGTHYIRQVDLGGRLTMTTAIHTCQASLMRLSTNQVESYLSAGFKEAVQDYLKENALPKSTGELSCGDRYSRRDSNCCLRKVSQGRLVVTVVRAWGLWGDYKWIAGDTEAYAVVTYGSKTHQTNAIPSNNPVWNATFDMGPFDKDLSLNVAVWDYDPVDIDDNLRDCTFDLEQGTHECWCNNSGGGALISCTTSPVTLT